MDQSQGKEVRGGGSAGNHVAGTRLPHENAAFKSDYHDSWKSYRSFWSDPVKTVDLSAQPADVRAQAAVLLVEHFDNHPRGWPGMESASAEVAQVIRKGFAIGALEGQLLLGWIGGLPEYDGRVWELHPLVVRRDHRLRGIGRELVAAFEHEARRRGALTLTLGTDDDGGQTSVADVDLYGDIPSRIAELQDLGTRHPFLFYRRLGYVVTGLMPDANGPGKPDIYMSKPVRPDRSG